MSLSFLVSLGDVKETNTEVVQSTVALKNALVMKIIWHLSFSLPSRNRPHYCQLYVEVLYFRFSL